MEQHLANGIQEIRKTAQAAAGWAGHLDELLGQFVSDATRVAQSPIGQAVARVILPGPVEQAILALIEFHGQPKEAPGPTQPPAPPSPPGSGTSAPGDGASLDLAENERPTS